MSSSRKSFFTIRNISKFLTIIFIAYFCVKYFIEKKTTSRLKVHQIIAEHGYPWEIHSVATEDGYILALHRILPSNSGKTRRSPVLIQHGAFNSAADFLVQGPEKALAYKLADEGFDVWLSNSRGSTYSRNHQFLNPDLETAQFFNFTFHEMGIFDLPASIDYILNKTGFKKLHYIGYSLGTSMFFVMGSERPEYLKKIRFMSALAPFANTKNILSPLVRITGYLSELLMIADAFLSKLGVHYEMFSTESYFAKYMRFICDENSIFAEICIYQLVLLHGHHSEHFDRTLLSTIYSNLPAGTSRKLLIHLLQLVYSGELSKFDYGKKLNLEVYNQEKPPEYNLTAITIPVALYYANNDYLVNVKDVEILMNKLPNLKKSYLVPLNTFTHNDFLYAKDADKFLYNEVIKEIKKW